MGKMYSFPVAQISKYRNILMGIGILDVLVFHFYSANGFTGVWAFVFGNITRGIFVQGFLFLSGFGLYYSYSQNNDTISFLKRRLVRVLVPYALMVAVFMAIIMSLTEWNWYAYLGYLTSLDYWNPWGYQPRFWYVSLTILLYIFNSSLKI